MWRALWRLLTQPLSESLNAVDNYDSECGWHAFFQRLEQRANERIQTLDSAIEEYKRRLDRANERMNELSNTRISLSKPDVHKPEDRQVRTNWEGRY